MSATEGNEPAAPELCEGPKPEIVVGAGSFRELSGSMVPFFVCPAHCRMSRSRVMRVVSVSISSLSNVAPKKTLSSGRNGPDTAFRGLVGADSFSSLIGACTDCRFSLFSSRCVLAQLRRTLLGTWYASGLSRVTELLEASQNGLILFCRVLMPLTTPALMEGLCYAEIMELAIRLAISLPWFALALTGSRVIHGRAWSVRFGWLLRAQIFFRMAVQFPIPKRATPLSKQAVSSRRPFGRGFVRHMCQWTLWPVLEAGSMLRWGHRLLAICHLLIFFASVIFGLRHLLHNSRSHQNYVKAVSRTVVFHLGGVSGAQTVVQPGLAG
ncbi:hypothetical protein KC368_g26 [Hortaea werneckii]|nr:hypothetical protein KC368_g26 [Hortaea werneckii]